MADDAIFESAKIEGLDLVIQTAGEVRPLKLNVRDIANTELVHDVSNFDTVRAFVGVKDPMQRPMFAPGAVRRRFVGVISDEEKLEGVRKSFKDIGAPVIEY